MKPDKDPNTKLRMALAQKFMDKGKWKDKKAEASYHKLAYESYLLGKKGLLK